MNDIVGKGNLPADFIDRLVAGVGESRAQTVFKGGGNLLRMSKMGTWLLNQENELVPEGTKWLFNVRSFQHGYVCWSRPPKGQKGELLGEIMDSMMQPKPVKPPPIQGYPFEEQRTVEVKAMNLTGKQAGLQLTYKTNSQSGLKAFDALTREFEAQVAFDRAHPFPIVELKASSYNHKEFGIIATPVFKIVGWADENGTIAGKPLAAPEPEPAAAEPPRKRNGKAAAKPADDLGAVGYTAPDEEDYPRAPVESTQSLHTGQRRRPIR